MTEKAVFYARAVVYYFDPKTKGWAPTAVGNSFCRVDMYENTSNNSFRVIGRGLQDTSQVVINSAVTKDTQYTRASDTFHQWSDNRYIYGLNFASKEEAEKFGGGFEGIVVKLKSGGGTATAPPSTSQPPPAPQPQTSQAPPAPQPPPAPKAPQPPPAPSAPAPPPAPNAPPAPPAPMPSSSESSGERGALLSSIQNFGKGGLKKVTTNDRSTPIVKKEDEGKASSSGGGGGGPMGMMGEILNARKKIVSGTPPAKKESSAPPPTKSLSSAPSKTSLNTSQRPAQTPPATPSPSHSGVSNAELNALKEEILAEIRKEIQQMKEEILNAIQQRG